MLPPTMDQVINIRDTPTTSAQQQRKHRRNLNRRRQRLQRPESSLAPGLPPDVYGGGVELRQIIDEEGGSNGRRTNSSSVAKEINSRSSSNKASPRKEILERKSDGGAEGEDGEEEEVCAAGVNGRGNNTAAEGGGVVRRRQINTNTANSSTCVVSCASAMGEEHRVISTEYRAAATQAIMKVTILAAGFVIGSRGISARLIGQATGAVVHSWTEYASSCSSASSASGGASVPVRLFRIDGKKAAVHAAVSLIHDAVARYKQLCESKRRGEFVQREQIIHGVEFYYQPPPRKAFISVTIPFSAAAADVATAERSGSGADRSPPPPPPPHHIQLHAPSSFRMNASPNWLAPPPPPAVGSSSPQDGLRRPPFLTWPQLRRPPSAPPPPMHDLLMCSLRRPSTPPLMPSSHLLSYYIHHPAALQPSPTTAGGAMASRQTSTPPSLSTGGMEAAAMPAFNMSKRLMSATPAPAVQGRQTAAAEVAAAEDCSLFSSFGQQLDIAGRQRAAESVGAAGKFGGGESCATTAFEFTACDFLRNSLPQYVLRAAEDRSSGGEYCLFGASPTLMESPAVARLGGAERMSTAEASRGVGGGGSDAVLGGFRRPWI